MLLKTKRFHRYYTSDVLKTANEQFEKKYSLGASGYDCECIVDTVAQVLSIKPNDVMASKKSPPTVRARALLCF